MPIIQKGIKKNTQMVRRIIGPHPIIQFFLEKLNFSTIIGSCIKQDERLKMPLERSLAVLVHNILTASMPMYEIAGWSDRMDEKSIGLEEGEAEFINDDRMGSSLSTFYLGKHKDFFFRLALRAIKVFKINCERIHQDTTSITLSGKYDSQDALEKITFGKNKDHRPDLKQLVLGMSVSGDGCVPLAHKVYSGNQSDDTLHEENHRQIRKLIGRNNFIYVADSKLATERNLKCIESVGGLFVCIMPKTWIEDKKFREMAKDGKIEWKHLLSKKNNRKPESKTDVFELAKGIYFSKKGYRLIWIKSSQKKSQDIETRERRLEKSGRELTLLSLKLGKRKLKTKKGIEDAIENVLKANHCLNLISYEVTSERIYKNTRTKPGRPSSNDEKKLTWKENFSLFYEIDEDILQEEKNKDGIFPLITNLPNSKKEKEILNIYKFQGFLEKRHCQIKTWQRVTPVLLKNPKRVVAYIHMHVVALTVASLIERKLRKEMEKQNIKELLIYPENRNCPYPTFYDIERLFRDVEKYEMHQGEDILYFPADLSTTQKKVLKLLEIPISLYQ